MMGGAHTLDAVMASAIAGLPASLPPALPVEDTLDLRDLVGKTVSMIDAYQFGWRMRFTDNTVICVNECQTLDRVGNYVREPE